jgi:hypothetical protein
MQDDVFRSQPIMPASSTTVASQGNFSDPLTQQLSVAKTVLLQAIDLLDNYLTSDEQLSTSSQYLPGSTIGTCRAGTLICLDFTSTLSTGKHLRHARDHFVLLAACMLQPPPYILSYDTRIRNTPMETSRSSAKEALLEAIRQLEEVVPSANMNSPITLHAVTPHIQEFQSTFGREVS